MTEQRTVLTDLRTRFALVSVFGGVLEDPAVRALRALTDGAEEPEHILLRRVSAFAAALYASGADWTGHLLDLVLRDENPYVVAIAQKKPIPGHLERAAQTDLALLSDIAAVTPEQIASIFPESYALPGWDARPLDFAALFRRQMADIGRVGYGMFARHHMFLVDENGLAPVQTPDPIDSETLTGYEAERGQVRANTEALLAGKPAANVLLYGDSGTGKSTCVKAVANELKDRGLRLVELRRDQLDKIPAVIARLSGNPLKFILFIDDLSFTQGGADFSALKAILEGSVSAKTANMVIYATSNRRHLVQERFSQRDGDDVHVRDTLEELSSLSERFGLTVTFLRPDRALYCAIAEGYCRQFGVPFDADTRRKAEAFALERGGRSARTARQFAERMAVQT